MSPKYLLVGGAIIILINFFLKLLPFVLFRKRTTPPWIDRLGRTLPAVMMTLLTIYCLKGIRLMAYPHGLPELIAVVSVVGLHLFRRNSLLSIFGGTAVYMIFLNVVFV